MSGQEAEDRLRGTLAHDKNEILFKEYKINYNNEPEMFKKGSILLCEPGKKRTLKVLYVDLIQESFWAEHSHLLER